MFNQYPTLGAVRLFETGMDMQDIIVMYRRSSYGDVAPLVDILAQHGLTYRDMMTFGQTKSLWGTRQLLDVKQLPLTRADWKRLGVTRTDDIGLSMSDWHSLPE